MLKFWLYMILVLYCFIMSRSRAGVVIFNYRDYNNVQRKIEGAIAILPFSNIFTSFLLHLQWCRKILFFSAFYVFSLCNISSINCYGFFTYHIICKVLVLLDGWWFHCTVNLFFAYVFHSLWFFDEMLLTCFLLTSSDRRILLPILLSTMC